MYGEKKLGHISIHGSIYLLETIYLRILVSTQLLTISSVCKIIREIFFKFTFLILGKEQIEVTLDRIRRLSDQASGLQVKIQDRHIKTD